MTLDLMRQCWFPLPLSLSGSLCHPFDSHAIVCVSGAARGHLVLFLYVLVLSGKRPTTFSQHIETVGRGFECALAEINLSWFIRQRRAATLLEDYQRASAFEYES